MDVAKSIIKGLTEAIEYKKGNLDNVKKIIISSNSNENKHSYPHT